MLLGIREAVRARWIVSIVLRFVFGALLVVGVVSIAFAIASTIAADMRFIPWLLLAPLLQSVIGVAGFIAADALAGALVPLHVRCPKCARQLSAGRAHPTCPGCGMTLDGPSSA